MSHPNIISLKDVFEDATTVYLVRRGGGGRLGGDGRDWMDERAWGASKGGA